jgi:Family of unknown function (DUF6412)
MTRVAAALSVLTVLLLGAAGVTDDPGVLLTLVGAALWALACVHDGRAAAAPGPAVVVPGRRTRHTTDGTSRQHHPDAAGRPRPRAPGSVVPAI